MLIKWSFQFNKEIPQGLWKLMRKCRIFHVVKDLGCIDLYFYSKINVSFKVQRYIPFQKSTFLITFRWRKKGSLLLHANHIKQPIFLLQHVNKRLKNAIISMQHTFLFILLFYSYILSKYEMNFDYIYTFF